MSVNIPNGRKILQHFPFFGPPKCTQVGIFGLKINHLATHIKPWKKFWQPQPPGVNVMT
jgi:hypothetical protein